MQAAQDLTLLDGGVEAFPRMVLAIEQAPMPQPGAVIDIAISTRWPPSGSGVPGSDR